MLGDGQGRPFSLRLPPSMLRLLLLLMLLLLVLLLL
jgi:hypothetical protein